MGTVYNDERLGQRNDDERSPGLPLRIAKKMRSAGRNYA
jgi:hypothetical protein